MSICSICKEESTSETFSAQEMVHGTGESFRYSLCGACGTLALVDPPADLAPYYKNYYSTATLGDNPFDRPSWLHRHFVNRAKRTAYGHSIFGNGPLARYLYRRKTVGLLGWGPIFSELRRLGIPVSRKTSFLDVGCGSGVGLRFLAYVGFTNLTGCDPFVDEEIAIGPGCRIIRSSVDQVQGQFDVVMLHHSFEHLPDPAASLRSAAALLAPDGIMIVRIPNIASIEFLKHKANWWGIHAPRHFFLPSQAAMQLMARDAGIEVLHVYCDSRYDHYLYSSEYALGIHDRHPLSFRVDLQGLWTRHEIKEAHEKAELCNRKMCGDWITYILRRPPDKGQSGLASPR